jgi:hypothetical protein
LHEPRAEQALGPREQPHEREPEDHEDEPRDPFQQELVGEETAANEPGAHAEQDEDRREAEHERDAGRDDPPRRSRLAEAVRVDRRHRREVAGDEREHAGSEERDEAGDECDRDRRRAQEPS